MTQPPVCSTSKLGSGQSSDGGTLSVNVPSPADLSKSSLRRSDLECDAYRLVTG
jgi:hypothetical protein